MRIINFLGRNTAPAQEQQQSEKFLGIEIGRNRSSDTASTVATSKDIIEDSELTIHKEQNYNSNQQQQQQEIEQQQQQQGDDKYLSNIFTKKINSLQALEEEDQELATEDIVFSRSAASERILSSRSSIMRPARLEVTDEDQEDMWTLRKCDAFDEDEDYSSDEYNSSDDYYSE